MIEVKNIIKTYEDSKQETVCVKSHWNRDNLIVLEVADSTVTLDGPELKAAIDNAMNTKRF